MLFFLSCRVTRNGAPHNKCGLSNPGSIFGFTSQVAKYVASFWESDQRLLARQAKPAPAIWLLRLFSLISQSRFSAGFVCPIFLLVCHLLRKYKLYEFGKADFLPPSALLYGHSSKSNFVAYTKKSLLQISCMCFEFCGCSVRNREKFYLS